MFLVIHILLGMFSVSFVLRETNSILIGKAASMIINAAFRLVKLVSCYILGLSRGIFPTVSISIRQKGQGFE